MCACARVRASGQALGARGTRGARGARRGRPGASRAAAGDRLLPRGLRSARPNLASRQLARRRPAAHLEGGAGARPWPSACPPAAHKAEPAEKERPEPDAPPAPRPRAPGAPPAPSITPRANLPRRREPPQRPASPRQTSAPLPPPAARCPAPSPAPGPRAGPPHPCLAPLLPRGRLGALGCCPRLQAKAVGVGGLHCMACPRTRPPRARAPPRGLARRVEASLQSAWWAPAAGGGAAAAAAEARLGSGGAARRERC